MTTDEFDLTINRDSGQLWLDDRRLLWNTIRELKPERAAETGTWRGGGSTFFITSAMRANGSGLLHSVESNPAMYAESVWLYDRRWPHLKPHVQLHFGDSLAQYGTLLADAVLDFVLLDGGETVTSAEFELLAPKVRVGGVLMVHDWFNGKFVPQLAEEAQECKWEVRVIGTGIGCFESGSVGFAKATKLR